MNSPVGLAAIIGRRVCCFAAPLLLAACAGVGASPPAPPLASSKTQSVQLPSGVTVEVAADWRIERLQDGLRLEGPEGLLVLELVEVNQPPDLATATETAWARRRPGFSRTVLASAGAPGRSGWEASRWTTYETSPQESRRVGAIAMHTGPLCVVMLTDAPASAVQRRVSQWLLVRDSLRPPGYRAQTYAGRSPRLLDATQIADLERFIEQAMKRADVPGLAVTLFSKDRVFVDRGFGVRKRGQPEVVDENTRFLIASNTKPLTTLLLAKLVDAGRVGWSTPVKDVYPRFRLGDDVTTDKVRLEHLVCACTGLPRQDFEWVFTFADASPTNQLELLATMKPTTEFGALFQYSNPLAAAAGYVAGYELYPKMDVAEAYDRAMQALVFDPLGMRDTTFSFEAALAANHASPHSWNLRLETVPIESRINESIVPLRPAGGAWSTARDLARYLRMELNDGRLPDGSVYVGAAALHARRAPKVRVREHAWYGMGLWLTDERGLRVINHGGSLFGYQSDMFFVPEAGVGGVILGNSDSAWPVIKAVRARFLEMLYDGGREAEEDLAAEVKEARTYLSGEQADWRVPADASLVARLAGRYVSPVLGGIEARRLNGTLVFMFDGWQSEMATKANPDGTVSFVTIEPSLRGLAFTAPGRDAPITELVIRDAQHAYRYAAVAE